MSLAGQSPTSGSLGVRVITRRVRSRTRPGSAAWPWRLRNRLRMVGTGEFLIPWLARLAGRFPGLGAVHASLYGTLTRADGTTLDLGLMGHHLVTTAGKTFLAGAVAGANTAANLKYHGCGTGTTAAAAGDTALQTESTTALNPVSTRATGTQTSSTNTYTTVGTLTFGATAAVTEWGLLTQSATGGGTLYDHQVFAAVNVAAGDSIQFTYVLTFT